MSDIGIARRYARALFAEAEAAGRIDRIDEDVVAVRDSLVDSPELQRLFASPLVSAERKKSVVARLFTHRVDELVVRLMLLLIAKGREQLLSAVVRAYAELRDEQRGEVVAQVRSALPLADDEVEALTAALEAATDRRIRLDMRVEPDLISGLVVRVGDRVFDRTGRHQLKTLREQFLARKFASN